MSTNFGMYPPVISSHMLGFDYTNTFGTTITSSSTAHVKGAYIEIASATENWMGCSRFTLYLQQQITMNEARHMFHLCLGPAGSETILVHNLWAHVATTGLNSQSLYVYDFPLAIPAGVRISLVSQSTATSAVMNGHIVMHRGDLLGTMRTCETIGANEADTGGTTINSGTADTFDGGWTEITASCPDIRGFVITSAKNGASWTNLGACTYELGVGAAGSEITVCQGFYHSTDSREQGHGMTSHYQNKAFAEGQRISQRIQPNITNVDFDLDTILYTFR